MPLELKPGWTKPSNSKKYHYFPENELRSVCMAWMYSGHRENENHDSPDNCAKCRKIVAGILAKIGKK